MSLPSGVRRIVVKKPVAAILLRLGQRVHPRLDFGACGVRRDRSSPAAASARRPARTGSLASSADHGPLFRRK